MLLKGSYLYVSATFTMALGMPIGRDKEVATAASGFAP